MEKAFFEPDYTRSGVVHFRNHTNLSLPYLSLQLFTEVKVAGG